MERIGNGKAINPKVGFNLFLNGVVLKVQWDTGASWVGYFLWVSMAMGFWTSGSATRAPSHREVLLNLPCGGNGRTGL
jgi:hypothetical protein